MIESKTKEFQGANGPVHVTVNQLDGMKGSILFFKLSKKILPAMARASGSKDAGSKLAMFTAVAEALDAAEFEQTARDLLSGHCSIRIPGEDLIESDGHKALGHVFRGKSLEIFKVLFFALETNFADFFDAAKSLSPSK